ncbi:AAA family ATPase [Thermohalobacter berrensis]|uniref:Nuclease SbcCD subunit C n=1 Tax=Thermohalobacter berrensis TaxID=99594 RepID=A0A419TAJ6_9FIRM|nr:AAA family ATPase [Thermohalobacter berrensis]RKD34498.1 hypothetical protein BET03_01315 [Thermohalobacter berrensis]
MIYIKKVILENFQSHKYTELEFNNKLNVIVGPSDQGKSAIIRGIKWVLYNEPTGTFFIRKGTKECSVTLVFNDGTTVKRLRSSSKNLYIYIDSNGKEFVYEGFGTKVPIDIIKKLNIKKVYLDGKNTNSINIGEQLEGPFLLSEKASTRANAIGRLVGVHIVDRAVTDTLKDIRNLNISRKNIERNLEELDNQLKNYAYLDRLKLTINKLEKANEKIKINQEKIIKLNKIKNKYMAIKTEKKDINKIILHLKDLESINKYVVQLDTKIRHYRNLSNKNIQYNTVSNNIKTNLDILTSMKLLDSAIGNFNILNNKIEKLKSLRMLFDKYNNVNKIRTYLKDYLKQMESLQLVEQINTKLIDKYNNLTVLLKNKQKLEDINKRLAIGEKYLDAFNQIGKVKVYIEKTENKVKILNKLIEVKSNYKSINNEFKKVKQYVRRQNQTLKKLLEEYSNLLKEIEICPVCLNKIDLEDIEKIINNYK